MRLKSEKIEQLAGVIVKALEANGEVTLGESPEDVTRLIQQVIAEDMQLEDEIEEEARRVLDEHVNMIQRKGVSYDSMLRKVKKRIARERKIVL